MDITKFGLQNFRVFKEHFDFDLAPIMVLTGPNNSGKSSVSKALLLLKENEDKISSDWDYIDNKIKYFKGEHDLGNHKLTINTKEENTYFSFTFFKDYKFKIEIDNEGNSTIGYIITGKENEIVIVQSGGYFQIILTELIQYFIDRLTFACSKDCPEHLTSKININKIEEFISQLINFSKEYWKIDLDINSDFYWQVGKMMVYKDKNVIKEIEENLKKGILTKLSYEEEKDGPPSEVDEEWQEHLIFLFKKITSVKLTKEEIHFLIPTSANISSGEGPFFKFSSIIYVNALREPLKRAYSRNDFSVFMNFMRAELFESSVVKYKLEINEKINVDINNITKFTQKWLNEFEIGEELSYGFDEENDIFFIKIDNKSLLEYGLGYGLIIHILLALISSEIDKIIGKKAIEKYKTQLPTFTYKLADEDLTLHFPAICIIEEPETGLHPAFQSKMAEMIVDIQRTFDVNLIIETHSEYFIRKLQYLTATNEINPGDAVIYYFNNPKKLPEGEEQIKKITIEKDGSLTDNFGPGFIDEGTNLKFELLRLNKSHQN